MELTPQTLHAVEFREARRGGYNTRDVDDFLERVAAGVGQLHERLRETAARAETAEARLIDVQRQFEDVQRRGPSMMPTAAPVAAVAVNETDDTLRRTLVLAQRTADATIKEAKQEANRLIDEARAEASRTRVAAEEDARRGADHARVAIEAELDGLIDQREALRGDLDVLNRHIDDQRERIRAGIAELRRIVEDDALLAPEPAPALADVDRPAVPPLPSREAFVPRPAAPTGPPPPGPADEPGSPFAAGHPGAHVGALQEPPASDNGPSDEAMPFVAPGDAHRLGGGASEGRIPWLPSELRTSVGDEPPEPAPPPPAHDPFAPDADPVGANGTDASADPETRPSEWGRGVFDPELTEPPENEDR
jgi:DivIVA domain-containing protein